MAADAVFVDAAETLVMADAVILGNVEETVSEEGVVWEKIDSRDAGALISSSEYEILLYGKKEGRCHLLLTEIVLDGEETILERSELLCLLNLNLREDAEIVEMENLSEEEDMHREFGTREIWYRRENPGSSFGMAAVKGRNNQELRED